MAKTRRTEILKAAYDLMGNEGLEAVHARTVAAQLGINHATVHYYFPKRVDLLIGICDFAIEQLRSDRAKFHQGLSTDDELLEAELALAEAYCKKTSRFAKVLAALYAASVSEPQVKKSLKLIWKEWSVTNQTLVEKVAIKPGSPYADGELLTATLFGFALTSHLTDGKFDAKAKIDDVFASMFE